jgi:hypothetical protein
MDRELRKRQAARAAVALLNGAYLTHRARIDREVAFLRMVAGMRRQAEEGCKPSARLSVMVREENLPRASSASHYS